MDNIGKLFQELVKLYAKYMKSNKHSEAKDIETILNRNNIEIFTVGNNEDFLWDYRPNSFINLR